MSTETEKLKLFKWDTSNEIDLESDFDIEKTLNENWDRIDDNTAEVSKKNIEQDNSISELQEEIENLRNISNIMPSVNETGENITLNNTAKNVRFRKFKVGGNSEQETREGYNLLNANLPYTTSSSGNTIKWLGKENIPKMEVNKYYYLHGKFSDGNIFSGAHAAFVITDSMGQILNKTFGSSFQNTVDISNAINCYIYTDSTYVNKTVTEVAIYEGKENKAYEQHGASPSPDYQSPIKTVGSNINIFDITKYDYRNFNEASVEITDSTNFRIIATTSKNANNAVGFKIMDLTKYAGKTLTLKAKVKSSTSTNKGFLVLRQNNADYTGTKSNEKYDETQNTTDGVIILQYKVADTINDSNRYLFAWFFATRGSECNVNDYVDYTVKMVEGTEAGEYSKYNQGSTKIIIEKSDKTQKQEYIMPVQKEFLTDDYFDLDNEEEVHGWKKIILNGTENWQLYSAGTNISRRFGLALTENVPRKETEKYGKGYSTHFEITQFINGDLSIFLQVEPNNWYIAVTDVNSKWSSIVEFKSWLKAKYDAGTPVIVYYKTAAETRIPFIDEQKAVAKEIQKATSYEDTTHIYSTDEVSPVFDVEAVIDLKKLIANTSTTAEGEG